MALKEEGVGMDDGRLKFIEPGGRTRFGVGCTCG